MRGVCAVTKSVESSSSSSTTPAVTQALGFVPKVTVYVCAVGAHQEIEPRQHYNMNASNAVTAVEHTSSDPLPRIRSIQQ